MDDRMTWPHVDASLSEDKKGAKKSSPQVRDSPDRATDNSKDVLRAVHRGQIR